MLAKFFTVCIILGQLNAAEILNSTNCGSRYGCFYNPKNCDSDQCEFVAKWRQIDSQVEFIIAAKFKNLKQKWLAIGFSHDKLMGNDSVVACKYNTENDLKIHNYFNPGQIDPELIDSKDPSSGLSDIKIINDKGLLICSFKRDISKNIENFFDLNQNYYILMAKGDLEKDGLLTYHGGDKVISQNKIDVSIALEAKSVLISTNFVKIHAILMVIAWPFLSTIGILFARYYKPIFPNVKSCGVQFWFIIHRPFMISVCLLSLIGFGFIFSYKNWTWTSQSSVKNFAHSIVGLITILLSLIQPAMAIFRPDKLAENRPIFNWAHRLVGILAYAFSITAVFLGVNMFVKNYHWIGLTSWIIWLIILVVLLEVFNSRSSTDKVHEKTNEFKIDENKEPTMGFSKPMILIIHIALSLLWTLTMILAILEFI
ncbi:ferric-chelate reductase 1 [Brachionus plicatilis]|uniref:Ferric-chelate reductase 1 n=1 Tax=Brachionus plicatilis TaxID=10195 RepID=A0A3M7QRH7_BRAPC|nr:ferric-chelate reductase 1 [Brachionus plicatilis]